MNRGAKIFGLGMLLIYILAAVAGLYVVYTEFLTGGVEESAGLAVGDYQGALLSAAERVEQRRYYVERAAPISLAASIETLYNDTADFLTRYDGDAEENPCDTYAYPLLLGCTNASVIEQRLTEKSVEAIADATRAYPRGGFTIPYTGRVDRDAKLTLSLEAPPFEEPILLNLGGKSPEAVASDLAGTDIVDGLSWPSKDRTVTSCFGPRSLSYGKSDIHYGFDIGSSNDVLAAMDGTVVQIEPQASGLGTVVLQHSDNLRTRYLHLEKSTITVHLGDVVKRNQLLGKASHTGCWKNKERGIPCGNHLHFEVLMREVSGKHAYSSKDVPGWTNVNPFCFFSDDVRDQVVVASAPDSCDLSSAPADPKSAYCSEYGLTLEDANVYQPGTAIERRQDGESGPATTEEPTVDDSTLRPNNHDLTSDQQEKFSLTEQRRYEHGWDKEVIAAASEYGVKQSLILGVITQESLGDPMAISHTGCAGIMQICYGTGKNLPGLGVGRMTICDCAGAGPSCACTYENDYRFHPDVAIPAGASLLRQLLDQFSEYTDQAAFAAAGYNAGPGVIQRAISGARSDTWKDVREYLLDHPELITYFSSATERERKVDEVTTYVDNVLAFAAAWNGGVALTNRDLGAAEGVTRIGTYRRDLSFSVETTDQVAPFLEMLDDIGEVSQRCALDENPEACLLAAADNQGWQSCEENGKQYFIDLYEALRDCSENGQWNCACALPVPVSSSYMMKLDADDGYADLFSGEERLTNIHFDKLTSKTMRVGSGEGVVPGLLELEGDGTLTYQELTGSETTVEPVTWNGWVVEKSNTRVEQLHFREEASGLPLCAPAKRTYTFCAAPVAALPPVRFAIELKESTAPEPVTNLLVDAALRVSFVASPSPDVSFYNVYAGEARPMLQLTGTSFDASAYIGKTLSVAPVDNVGNEGAAVSVVVQAAG